MKILQIHFKFNMYDLKASQRNDMGHMLLLYSMPKGTDQSLHKPSVLWP